ncbi:MAG: lasso RiPP family leader peptide-containing protein [Lysobacterales bacterium]
MNLSIESERKDVRDQQPSPTVYEAPVLRALGDIRELTLGGSLGTGDSGNALIQQV